MGHRMVQMMIGKCLVLILEYLALLVISFSCWPFSLVLSFILLVTHR